MSGILDTFLRSQIIKKVIRQDKNWSIVNNYEYEHEIDIKACLIMIILNSLRFISQTYLWIEWVIEFDPLIKQLKSGVNCWVFPSKIEIDWVVIWK